MDSIWVIDAKYIEDYRVWLQFNNGESGEADLREIIFKNKAAQQLRDPVRFSSFFLDSWPTLAWECGFDIAPEALYKAVQTYAVGESLNQ
ncbi:MAG TPA: DUF2442 domain-containing protein [Chitinispirillaceae bacterium]|nr:DUF2442 domain-containing protein [Chitinispirillaceae bacterium]